MDLSTSQVQVLVQKLQIVRYFPTLHGHAYAQSARRLYLENRLKLVSVADLRNFKRVDAEIDLTTPASVCTYDELASVTLNKDLTVTLHIQESTRSFHAHPSVPRVNFALSGDWWAINKLGEGFPQAIEDAFKRYAAQLQEEEEELRRLNRCREIEAQLLAGSYEKPEDVR